MGTRRSHVVLGAWVGIVLSVGTAVVGAQSTPAPRSLDVTATGLAGETPPASRSPIPATSRATSPPTPTSAPPTTATSMVPTTAVTSPPDPWVVVTEPARAGTPVPLATPPDPTPPSAPVADVVSGLVTDVAGNPVPGVCVHATNGGEFTPVTRTGVDGRYVLAVELGRGLASTNETPHLLVGVPACGDPLGWVSDGRFLRNGRAPSMTADLVVRRGAAIHGRLVDPDGRPVNDVDLSVLGHSQVVQADGTFGPVGPLPPGEVFVQGVRVSRWVMLNDDLAPVVFAPAGVITEVLFVVRPAA